MTMHSAIGILVAVAVPLWLVVEQILKWRVLEPRTLPSPARTETDSPSKAPIPDRRREVPGVALHRKMLS
jgi:hypothetical protein